MISPMLLHKCENNRPFNDSGYLAQLKLDGVRLIVSSLERIRLHSRHQNEYTYTFPELLDPPVDPGTILDGEVIITNEEGKPDFEALESRLNLSHSKAMVVAKRKPVTYCAFDIIQYRGKIVTGMTLIQRQELLKEALKETDQYKIVRSVDGSVAQSYYEAIRQQSLEGIVLKRKQSKYHMGTRSWDWLKVINYQEADVWITGFWKTRPGFLISFQDRAVGTVELGITIPVRKKLYQTLRPMAIKENKHQVLVRPQIQCRVRFRNWTKAGMMRLPELVTFLT